MQIVRGQHWFGRAELRHLATPQPQGGIAEMANVIGAVRAKQDGAAAFAERHDAFDAFLLEMLVAHSQGFIDDQHVRLHRCHQRKRQPHRHTG